MLALTAPRRFGPLLALALACLCLLVPTGVDAVEAAHVPLRASSYVAPAHTPPPLQTSVVGLCDSRAGEKVPYTAQDRQEVRDRVKHACEMAGDAPIVCAFYDAVVMRESRGRASVRHNRARGEDGLGPMGLSLRWHADKWPGDPDPDFCTPEASLAVARAIVRRAWVRYSVADLLDVQAIYSGRWGCWASSSGKRSCVADPSGHTRAIICKAMRTRGYSCHTKLKASDFGAPIRKHRRGQWALDAHEGFKASQ